MAATDHIRAVRPRSYQNDSYLRGFLGTVGDLQKNRVLQDVVIEVEGRRFPCHRLVLSAASPYFRAMFTSDMAESRQKTVVLQCVDASIFGEILKYIYSGTLHVSMDRVQPLYQAADLLQLDYVRDTCSSYMAMNVERSHYMDLYKFADIFSVNVVRKACLQMIRRNFVEVASSEDFYSLSINQLTEIISHDDLDVKEETTVWETVVRWVQYSREDRLHHLPSILPQIRFNLLTSDDTAAILEHPLVKEDPGSSEVIRNVKQKGKPNLNPRLGMTTELVLLSNTDSKELLFMNPLEGKYISCGYKPEDFPCITDVTVTRDNNIYILTRKGKSNGELSMLKYNHAGNVWEHAVWHTDQWQECAQLQLDNTEYDYSEALACGSHLYFLTSLELHCYDRSQNCWCKRSPASDPDLDIYSAVTKGTELFCADFDFKQIMVYDTESDRWQKLQGWPNKGNRKMKMCISPCLFVMDNQLHIWLSCVDDEDDKEELLVYVYDRSADVWRDVNATLPNKTYFSPGPMCPVAHQELHASAVRLRSYQDESYLHGFLGSVCDLQKAGVLQDVVLEVEGRRFPCHRLVLSAASPYFRAMFTVHREVVECNILSDVARTYPDQPWGRIRKEVSVCLKHRTYDATTRKERRMAQAPPSAAAIAPNVRLSMPDGTVLGKARERERRGSIVSLTLLEVTPAGREHPAFVDSEQVPRDMTVNNAIYNVQVSPLASTSS
uniref:BTB domain-containing protein n=1 Tax=Branchiostoma floridae TaxID=7739 RepID=C3ZY76_BRAFL|eukprot:XP_002586496.1 hypothetical protein BRAFLDRAFT_75135 [Branchiostoma floridae]